MIKFESSLHWYTKEGQPQHDADLRVARKQFLYPSVTTIDKDVFKNDFLDKWKLNQVAEAAALTFKQPHESNEDFSQRIYEDSLEKARTASHFGKRLHKVLEDYPAQPVHQELLPWFDKFGAWYEENIETDIHREKVFLDHDLGVAGTCDRVSIGKGRFQGERLVLDYKSQDVKKDSKTGKKKPAFYESWPRQLGFYGFADAKEAGLYPDMIPTCISLVMDSNEASEPYVKVWSKEEIIAAYKQFIVGAWLWFDKRKFYPAAKGKWDLIPTLQIPA